MVVVVVVSKYDMVCFRFCNIKIVFFVVMLAVRVEGVGRFGGSFLLYGMIFGGIFLLYGMFRYCFSYELVFMVS